MHSNVHVYTHVYTPVDTHVDTHVAAVGRGRGAINRRRRLRSWMAPSTAHPAMSLLRLDRSHCVMSRSDTLEMVRIIIIMIIITPVPPCIAMTVRLDGLVYRHVYRQVYRHV